MTSRTRSVFACTSCGFQSPKWLGRCPECGRWSTLVEETAGGAGPGEDRARPARGAAPRVPARSLPEIDGSEVKHEPSGVDEFDRCLGGGLVPGSLVLLGGEPGIGKSTLLLQVSEEIARSGRTVLYVSGEESPGQLKLRAGRLGAASAALHVLGETDLDAILSEADRLRPAALVIDSVQVVRDQALESSSGTVSQVKQVADRLLLHAKQSGTTVMLIGHVTKDGQLAGPRTLEHLVDVVLSFECESGHVHRLVRTLKNRFGPSGEVGVFEMRGDGLAQVPDASRLFLSERRSHAPGSVVFPSMEGTRPVLVEIQALVAGTVMPQPRRMSIGIDGARLCMLLAVLERRGEQDVLSKDVFINVAGGLKLRETAADLPVVLAVTSAAIGLPLPDEVCAFGEIGLSGEVRSVDRALERLREARGLGFERCLLASGNAEAVASQVPQGLQIVEVSDVLSAIECLWDTRTNPGSPTRIGPRLVK
jgi:DNA repair protein RadA/Sms